MSAAFRTEPSPALPEIAHARVAKVRSNLASRTAQRQQIEKQIADVRERTAKARAERRTAAASGRDLAIDVDSLLALERSLGSKLDEAIENEADARTALDALVATVPSDAEVAEIARRNAENARAVLDALRTLREARDVAYREVGEGQAALGSDPHLITLGGFLTRLGSKLDEIDREIASASFKPWRSTSNV